MKNIEKEFIGFVVSECSKNKVSVSFFPSRLVLYSLNQKSSGFFNSDDKCLVVACGKPVKKWIPILAHEFCHFLQWKEKYPGWQMLEGKEEIFWSWLDGAPQSHQNIVESKEVIQNVELDCEKRVVNLIDEFHLPIDKREYIRTANSYVMFYDIVLKYRKWYKKPPYEVSEIVNMLPEKFMNPGDILPKEYERIVLEKCF